MRGLVSVRFAKEDDIRISQDIQKGVERDGLTGPSIPNRDSSGERGNRPCGDVA